MGKSPWRRANGDRLTTNDGAISGVRARRDPSALPVTASLAGGACSRDEPSGLLDTADDPNALAPTHSGRPVETNSHLPRYSPDPEQVLVFRSGSAVVGGRYIHGNLGRSRNGKRSGEQYTADPI